MTLLSSKVRGRTYKIVKNSFRLDVRKNFFSNRVVDAWNELPQYVVDAETVNSFRTRLFSLYSENNPKSYFHCTVKITKKVIFTVQ